MTTTRVLPMYATIKDLFGAGKDAQSLIREIRSEKRNAKGVINAIFAETEYNMSLILEHYLRAGVDPVKIIGKLKVQHLARAIEDGFDFRKIKRGKIQARMLGDAGFLRNYVGYDCEKLLKNIRFHIDQLHLLPDLYDLKRTDKVNVRARLENLGKRYLLLTKFVRYGS
ncbi:MAG: hypothetical protein OEM41_03390 [Ignavibacteria bacterium]|nr:hypothetical protein [Ignavibacteria bacterium]